MGMVVFEHFLCIQCCWVSWHRIDVWFLLIVLLHSVHVQMGPGFSSMSPDRCSRSASHVGDTCGWPAEKTAGDLLKRRSKILCCHLHPLGWHLDRLQATTFETDPVAFARTD